MGDTVVLRTGQSPVAGDPGTPDGRAHHEPGRPWPSFRSLRLRLRGVGGTVVLYFFSWSRFFSRSSSPPHMKKACSGTLSYSPSVIALNACSVSESGTNDPG